MEKQPKAWLKKIEKIAKRKGTPVFILDHEKIRQNYKEFKEAAKQRIIRPN